LCWPLDKLLPFLDKSLENFRLMMDRMLVILCRLRRL
jgi:hypothetical protein